MAIDDREKRQSAFSAFNRPTVPSVTPNATPDQEWRQQALWGYSGILAGGAPTGRIMGALIGPSGLVGHGGGLVK